MKFFYSFYFIVQGKIIILRTRCFLHQNISQLQWFKAKTLLQSQVFKGFKAWSAFGCKVAEKARGNSEHPNTKISHRLRNDKFFGFGAKLTLTAGQEDDKSIYNHHEDAEEPDENPKPRFH